MTQTGLQSPDRPIHVTVRLFAAAREAFGRERLRLRVPPESTVRSLRNLLCQLHPGTDNILAQSAPAVNREYAGPDTPLSDGDEVAFLPPVGGG